MIKTVAKKQSMLPPPAFEAQTNGETCDTIFGPVTFDVIWTGSEYFIT